MALAPMLGLGFILGITHAADADHVVAVSTIVSSHDDPERASSVGRRLASAARLGTFWGIGHTLTILIVGGILVGSRWVLPERVAAVLELVVCVMLMVLGVASLLQARRAHAHSRSAARSLAVGIVHGLAGSGAVALLVLSRTTSAAAGVGYLACFGCGTIAGMVLLTTAMSLPIVAATQKSGVARWIQRGAAAASLILGAGLFVRILTTLPG